MQQWMKDVSEFMKEHGIFGVEGNPDSGNGLVNYVPDKASVVQANKALVIGGLDLAIADGTLQSVQIKKEDTKIRLVLSKVCSKVSDKAFNYLQKKNDNIVFVFDDSLEFSVNVFKGYASNNFRIDISGISNDYVAREIYKAKDERAYKVIDKTDRRKKFFSKYLLSHKLADLKDTKSRNNVLKWFTEDEIECFKEVAFKTMSNAVSFLTDLLDKDIKFRHNNNQFINISDLKSMLSSPCPLYSTVFNLPLSTEDINSRKWRTCVNCFYLFSDSQTKEFNDAYKKAASAYMERIYYSASDWYASRGYRI